MRFKRTLSRVPTFTTVYYERTIGHRVRDCIAATGSRLKPVRRYLLPNFIAVHYLYIVSLTILASILLYPVKNAKYIDILFLATGATTQGGLNTINVNDLSLYQQIVVYVTCWLSTPIIIHGFLAFVRLYWFERYFDDIKVSSKRNFKMRRTRTILNRELTARTLSRASRWNTTESHLSGVNRPDKNYRNSWTNKRRRNEDKFNKTAIRKQYNENFQEKLFSGKLVNREEEEPNNYDAAHNNSRDNESNDSKDLSSSTPSSNNGTADLSAPHRGGLTFQEPVRGHEMTNSSMERFAKRRGSSDITPADMFRSITLMQKQHQPIEEEGADGPVLIVSPPTERMDDSIRGNNQNGSEHTTSSVIDPAGPRHTDVFSSSTDDMSAITSLGGSSGSERLALVASTPRLYQHSIQSEPSPNMSLHEADDEDDGDISRLTDTNRGQRNSGEHPPVTSIQFDIKEPPRRRPRAAMRSHSSSTILRAHSSPRERKRVRKSLLKHLPGGGSFRQRIKRRLSSNSIETFNEEHDDIPGGFETSRIQSVPQDSNFYTQSAQASKDDDFDHYLADNESNEEEQEDINHIFQKIESQSSHHGTSGFSRSLERSRTYDLGSSKYIDDLTQSPHFQKMVYKNWKQKHRRKKHTIANPWSVHLKHGRFHNDGLTRMGTSSDSESFYDDTANTTSHMRSKSIGSIFAFNNDASERRSLNNYSNNGDYDEEMANYSMHFDPDYHLADPSHMLSRTMSTNYLSWSPTIGRNSTFVGMSKVQKNELGGVEYRAIKVLCLILVVYYVGLHILAFVLLVPWICRSSKYSEIVRGDGISPAWWGFFTGMSAFADLGLTVTPDSMNSFVSAIYPLIVMIWFIIVGNTGFPVLLRCIIWVLFKLSPELSQRKESLGFLLDHPRRCFTLLFPTGATWWLLLTLVTLTATDLVLFIIFDFGSTVTNGIAKGRRVLAGLFQGVSTRTAGFSVFDLSKVHPSIQVWYMLMMYVSVLPLAISIRRTNVYEEQSLGIYGSEEEEEEEQEQEQEQEEQEDGSEESQASTNKKKKGKPSNSKKNHSTKSFITQHVRRQLSFDLWFLFLGLFIICICEGGKIRDDTKPAFNVFSVLFEIVSAYGTVGLSLGYPNTNQSFSAQFTTLSKLVIIALLIRGRNRGLPYTLDRAIMLPSDRLEHIDHIQDRRAKKEIGKHNNDDDPVTQYVKKNLEKVVNGFNKFSKMSSPKHQQEDTEMAEYREGLGRGSKSSSIE